jgi:hypothetical protein
MFWGIRSLPVSIVLIAVLLVPILLFPHWYPGDDWLLLKVISTETYDVTHLGFTGNHLGGRFLPLAGVDFKLIWSAFGSNPFAFYLYSFAMGMVTLSVLAALSKKLLGVVHLSVFLLATTPGFASAFYELNVPEKTTLFLCVLFVGILLYGVTKASRGVYFCFVPALFAVFSKESAFIMPLVLAASWWILDARQRAKRQVQQLYSRKRVTVLCTGVAVTGLLYLGLYLYFGQLSPAAGAAVYLRTYRDQLLIGGLRGGMVHTLVASLRSLSLFLLYDPILTLLLPALTILRIRYHRDLSSERPTQNIAALLPLFDAMSFSVFPFMAFFVVTGLADMRYLLPSYSFAIPAIWAYAYLLAPRIKSTRWIQAALVAVGVMILSACASGINHIVYVKSVSYNMAICHQALARELQDSKEARPVDEPTGVFIPGAQNDYAQTALSAFLEFRGVDTSRLAFRSKAELHSGDYVVMLPNMARPMSSLLAEVAEKYRLRPIVQTKSPYYIQLPDLRQLVKAVLIRFRPALVGSQIPTLEVDHQVFRVY